METEELRNEVAGLYNPLLRIARKELSGNPRLGRVYDAEDLVQELYLKLDNIIKNYNPKEGTLYNYVSKIFDRMIIDVHRRVNGQKKRKRKRPLMFSLDNCVGNSPETGFSIEDKNTEESYEIAERNEQRYLVGESVENLPERYRTILEMYYFQELSYQKVADALGIPLGTVKSRLHNAREELKENKGLERYRRDAA